MKKEFISVFQITKLILFEVEYYTLSTNKTAHFSTSVIKFCRNKKDITCGGQAQDDLLPGHKAAYDFYKKWDSRHLHDLTDAEYDEMVADLEKLKSTYNYLYKELNEEDKPYNPHFSFYTRVEFSKQPLKK